MRVFPRKPLGREKVLRRIRKELALDKESGRVLGSMVCRQFGGVSKKAFSESFEKNLGDPGVSEGCQALASETLSMVSSLFHSPVSDGVLTTGGSESNFLALAAYKSVYGKNKIVLPSNSHFSFKKAAAFLGLKLVSVPLKDFRADPDAYERLVDRDTLCLVANAGATQTGFLDDVGAIAEVAEENGLPLHVDAAYGGFSAPFLYPGLEWDFRLRGVSSVSASAHKWGLVPPALSLLFFRNKRFLRALETRADYLTGPSVSRSLSGSVNAAPLVSLFANIVSKGREGFSEENKKAYGKALDTRKYAFSLGFNALKPQLPILPIVFPFPPDLTRERRRWAVSVSRLGKRIVMRLVFYPYTNTREVGAFLGSVGRSYVPAKIFSLLRRVPKNRVVSYSELARAAGVPGKQRWVARVLNLNVLPGFFPCFRVVEKNGKVGGFSRGVGEKKRLLKKAGIVVEGGLVAKEFFWRFP